MFLVRFYSAATLRTIEKYRGCCSAYSYSSITPGSMQRLVTFITSQKLFFSDLKN